MSDTVIKSPNLFLFSNPQDYLRAWLAFKQKQEGRKFSLQAIANRLQIISKSHLHRIFTDANTPIPTEIIPRLSHMIGHNVHEAEYFEAMVLWQRAKTLTDKTHQFEKMQHCLQKVNREPSMVQKTYEFFSDWRLPLLRELACLVTMNNDPSRMARQQIPPLSVSKVKKALQQLMEYGFLQQDEQGNYQQTESWMDTPKDIEDMAVFKFQRQMLQQAIYALENTPVEKREIVSTTFSLAQELMPEFKQRLRDFQEETARWILDQKIEPNTVYQLNTQLFPLSREKEES